MAYKIAKELAQESLKQADRQMAILASVHTYLLCKALYQKSVTLTSGADKTTKDSQEDRRAFAEIQDLFQSLLQKKYRWFRFHETLKVNTKSKLYIIRCQTYYTLFYLHLYFHCYNICYRSSSIDKNR